MIDIRRALVPVIVLVCAGCVGNADVKQSDDPSVSQGEALTIERLFEDPDLSGPAPKNVKISPDGERVGFLRGSADNQLVLDLWSFDLASSDVRQLVASDDITGGVTVLSAEEEARRERQRTAALKGIVDYSFSPDGNAVLFPLNGDLYLYDLAARLTTELVKGEGAEIDPQFSPAGDAVAFVRDGDLYVVDVGSQRETRLTRRDSEDVTNGLAEFIAQEEMDRDTGYWWSPDGQRIAFLQVDESNVRIEERFEVLAETVNVVRQRYPATGTTNVDVRLGIVDVATGDTRWLDLGADTDIYVARVDWFPESDRLVVQRQSRNQQTLDLLDFDVQSGDATVLLTETSDTWIDLFDDLTFLPERQQFVWSSARNGYKHLYLYDYRGELIRQLTDGEWEVTGDRNQRALLHVDERTGRYLFMATKASPTERHLYEGNLRDERLSQPARVTRLAGWHDVEVSPNGQFFVDAFSAGDRPPSVAVHRSDGSLDGYIEENPLDSSHPYWRYLPRHASAQFGQLQSEDGQELHYYVRRPATATEANPAPAIVMVYGGPHGPRVKNIWGGFFEQVLVANGYVVFSVDNRGTDFRGTDFDRPIYRNMGDPEVRDQAVGARYLQSRPFVDSERVGVFGWSYGGYMTLMCMLKTPELYAAGVSGAPVTDWRLYDTHYTERYMGTPLDNEAGYLSGNVLPLAGRLSAPLLLMHGMADDNVLFTHTTALMKALQDEGKVFELMTYPGGKHGLLRIPEQGRHGYRTILDFFNRKLRPGGR